MSWISWCKTILFARSLQFSFVKSTFGCNMTLAFVLKSYICLIIKASALAKLSKHIHSHGCFQKSEQVPKFIAFQKSVSSVCERGGPVELKVEKVDEECGRGQDDLHLQGRVIRKVHSKSEKATGYSFLFSSSGKFLLHKKDNFREALSS